VAWISKKPKPARKAKIAKEITFILFCFIIMPPIHFIEKADVDLQADAEA
jgi:hypothetical protein